MNASQNGWPASTNTSEIDVIDVELPLSSKTFTIGLARTAADALVEMAFWWDQNIEPITSLYGYNYREIRGEEGTGNLSNHASGTAIDINASQHPLGAEGTVPSDMRAAISAKAKELGLRWGGDFNSRKDEMHFEVNVPYGGSMFKATSSSLSKQASGAFNYWWLVAGAAAVGAGAVLYWYFVVREDET